LNTELNNGVFIIKPEKVVIIGLDALIPERVYNYAMRGYLPNIKKLIDEGVYCENCLVPYPTIIPPNWTTIVTGAWPVIPCVPGRALFILLRMNPIS